MYSYIINLDIIQIIEISIGALSCVASTTWLIVTKYNRIIVRIENLEKTIDELKEDYKDLLKQNYVHNKSNY